MSQNEERARAVKQARKLMEMTTGRGASENESKIAMERLSKIRQTYNLTLDEIVISDLNYITGEVEKTAVKGCPLDSVIVAIGRFTETKVWNEPGKKKYRPYIDRYGRSNVRAQAVDAGTYKFFGIDTDVEMATFLYDMIVRALKNGEEQFMKSKEYTGITFRGGKRRALVSFRKGYAGRVYRRLEELTAEREKDTVTNIESTGSDIVIVKEEVREAKFREQLGIKLVKKQSYKRGASHMGGFKAGHETANNVNFNRPVNGSSEGSQKLLL